MSWQKLIFIGLIIACVMFVGLDQVDNALQFTERLTWVSADDAGFDVQYFIGVDGLSATIVLSSATPGDEQG